MNDPRYSRFLKACGAILSSACLTALLILALNLPLDLSAQPSIPLARQEAGQTERPSPRTALPNLFVSPGGVGNTCTQAQACALPTALAQAAAGELIWLAGGTYTGGGGAVLTVTQSLSLYGGWDGSPAGPLLRDPAAYPTILDGQRQRRGAYAAGDITVRLEGLGITRGNADDLGGGLQSWHDAGGGLYALSATLTLSDCQIWDNQAGRQTGYGGGVFVDGSSGALLYNNQIHHNVGGRRGYGGGLGLLNSSACILEDNLIFSNTASLTSTFGNGGGLWISGAQDLSLQANRVLSNEATVSLSVLSGGGGAQIDSSSFNLINNVIRGNDAWTGGGLQVFSQDEIAAQGKLIHNTVVSNTGDSGLAAGRGTTGNDVRLALTNTIIAGHSTGLEAFGESNVTLQATLWWNNDRDVQGHVQQSDDRIGDPRFDADGYHLLADSAAINAGVDAGVVIDIDREARPLGGGYDLGADEFAQFVPLTEVGITGPTWGVSNALVTLRAVVTPVHATPPISYTWSPAPPYGQDSAQARYLWAQTGPQTVTLTAGNQGSALMVTASHRIEILGGVQIYLPVLARQ